MNDRSTKTDVIGALFVLSGVFLNVWVLGSLFSPFGKVTTPGFKAVIWAFDIVAVASGTGILIGGRAFMKRLFFTFAALFVMTAAVEAGLHAAGLFVRFEDKKVEDVPDLPPLYEADEWAEDYRREYRESVGVIRYSPFIVWTRGQFRSKHINIDSEGRRRTWNPQRFSGSPKKIYMFGGSTMWGYGARDDHTIPSCLSRILNGGGREFLVLNYGEEAYTFKQEAVRLLLLLQAGHRPDYVIFYDGVNDAAGAYQTGEAGGHMNFESFRQTLEKRRTLSPLDHIITGVAEAVKKHSMILRAAGRIMSAARPSTGEAEKPVDDGKLLRLAGDIVEDYVKTMGLVERLSGAYGFGYLCLWQPNIFTEKRLVGAESGLEAVDVWIKDKALRRLYVQTNEYLLGRPIGRFYNISDALSDRTQPYYFDFSHLSERGNEAVAARIAAIFEEEFLKRGKGQGGRR